MVNYSSENIQQQTLLSILANGNSKEETKVKYRE